MKKNFFVGQDKKTFVQEIKNAFDSIYIVSETSPSKEVDFWLDTSNINNIDNSTIQTFKLLRPDTTDQQEIETLVFEQKNDEVLIFWNNDKEEEVLTFEQESETLIFEK